MARNPRRRSGNRPKAAPERMKTIAANLRRLADEKGMPIVHVADHAGIGRTTLWRILDVQERGATDPRLSTLDALAGALEVDVLDLLRPAREAAP